MHTAAPLHESKAVMQGETGLFFPRNCQAYCMYAWSVCLLVSPMLFRTGLLASHQFICSDLPLDTGL